MISTKNYGFGHCIYVQVPRVKQPIPLFILFRALGIISDEDICSYILLDLNDQELKRMLFGLKGSIIDANKILSQEKAIQFVTSNVIYTPINMTPEAGKAKKEEFAKDVLNNDLFPHCKSKKQKIYFLGYMANLLLKTSFGWRDCDDRDSYINKRLDSCGILLTILHQIFNLLRSRFG